MYNHFQKLSLTVLLLIISKYASASIISVDAPTGVINDSDGLCSISEAVVNANNDAATYMDCTNGNGVDTIEIQQDITLSEFHGTNATNGNSGLPLIESEIIINGNGFLVQRDNNLSCDLNDSNEAGEFRLLHNLGNLTIQNVKLSNGCSDGSFLQSLGGGILNNGTLSIIDSQFSQNKAIEWGGVLHNRGLIIEISNSTFDFNTASQGGAFSNSSGGSITEITNSTFSANIATSTAGAILNINGGMINHISNSSFVNNTSIDSTSVIQNNLNSTITNLTNSLFKNNSGNRECGNFSGDFDGFNNISDNSSSFCPGTVNSLTASSVGPLADNGGATMTHALLVGSEALDASIDGSGNDQRGFAADGARDIGAYEAQIPVVTAPNDITTISTGATTPVDLGMASVSDADEMGLTASPSDSGPFADGTHEITWTAIDSHGHVGTDTQMVTIKSNIDYDVAISNPTAPEYTIVPVSIGYISESLGFTIHNNGSNTIFGFFLNRQYVVDGEIIQDFDNFIDMELQPSTSTFVDTGPIGIGEGLNGIITANYSVTLNGEEDENPSDNSINDIFLLIADTKEMARDDQIATIATELTHPNGTQIGQLFSINNESTLESVLFVFSNKTCDANTGACSLDGLGISAKIYSADMVTGRPIMEFASTESYNVPNGKNLEIIQNLPIAGGPIILPSGNYVAVIDTPSDPDPNDTLLPSLGLYFTDNRFTEGTTWYDIGGQQNWENLEDLNFFKTPLIRLNFVNPDIIFSSSFE